MRKTLSIIALIVGLSLTTPAAAQAYSWPNNMPDLPGCASTIPSQPPSNWANLETRCSVTATGDDRLFVNLLELFVDELNQSVRALEATVAEQSATIAAQGHTIAKQRVTIKRLRHRLSSTD